MMNSRFGLVVTVSALALIVVASGVKVVAQQRPAQVRSRASGPPPAPPATDAPFRNGATSKPGPFLSRPGLRMRQMTRPGVPVFWGWGTLPFYVDGTSAPLADGPTGGVQLDVQPWRASVFVGNAGSEVSHLMRRGWIAVGGACGDWAGYAMLAGSLFVIGPCGTRPGAGMRRGTIALFGSPSPELLPTFRFACRYGSPALQLMARQLAAWGFPRDQALDASDVDLFQGDFLEGGRGEIWIPAT